LSFARFVGAIAAARTTGTSLAAWSSAPGHRRKPKTIQTPRGRVGNDVMPVISPLDLFQLALALIVALTYRRFLI
jgi:hypothetical protein